MAQGLARLRYRNPRVVEDDPELVARLMPAGYDARAEQAILFSLASVVTDLAPVLDEVLSEIAPAP